MIVVLIKVNKVRIRLVISIFFVCNRLELKVIVLGGVFIGSVMDVEYMIVIVMENSSLLLGREMVIGIRRLAVVVLFIMVVMLAVIRSRIVKINRNFWFIGMV